MKSLKFILVAMSLLTVGYLNAQISVGDSCGTYCRMVAVENSNPHGYAGVTTIAPPPWGPVGYAGARYYYLPDVESYYDIKDSLFIYLNGNNWIFNNELPAQYANYDIDHGYKVVLTGYIGNTPYTNFNENKKKYPVGYRGEPQITFKDKPIPTTDNAPPINYENDNHEVKK